MFGVLNIPFCVKALEIDMYFTLTAFFNSDQPTSQGLSPRVAGGSRFEPTSL